MQWVDWTVVIYENECDDTTTGELYFVEEQHDNRGETETILFLRSRSGERYAALAKDARTFRYGRLW